MQIKQISVRIPLELWSQIGNCALSQNKMRGEFVTDALIAYIKNMEKKPSK